MALTLGHTINQGYAPLLPGDIDDCWVVAALQCARTVGGSYAGAGHWSSQLNNTETVLLPTIPTFRKFAGKPDVQGVSNGGSADDILKGAIGAFPALQIVKASTSWDTFVHQVRDLGWIAAVATKSGLLPAALQYGFLGAHEVSIRYDGTWGGFEIVNPLAPQGQMPQRITAASLKQATLGLTGTVGAVLFRIPTVIITPEPLVVVVPDVTPFSQADIDASKTLSYNQGYATGVAKGVADTKAAARIVYE